MQNQHPDKSWIRNCCARVYSFLEISGFGKSHETILKHSRDCVSEVPPGARKCRNTHFFRWKSVVLRLVQHKNNTCKYSEDTLFSIGECVFLHFRAARRDAGIADGIVICNPNHIYAFPWKPGFRSSRGTETRLRDLSGCRFLAHARNEFLVSTKRGNAF